ncbi:MAG: prepilin-type N-terminal cleavage/methylation domain-containing protein [Patescibacteria group bacterium]
MKKEIENNKGFTIVETLVAITILMIAIAGPLTVAFRGLTAAVYAHDQVTASYLAQDAMEYIKNVRDNNLKTPGRSWLDGINTTSLVCTNLSDNCTVNTLNNPYDTGGGTCGPDCYLYLKSDGSGYTPESGGNKQTQFTRKYYITSTSNPDEVTATVIVEWKNGTVSNAVTLSSQLFNIRK